MAVATRTVNWFNATKSFGFIQPTDGGRRFVHISAGERGGMRDLNEGQKISYYVIADKGTGKSSAANLNQCDEEFADPVALPFNWRDDGGSRLCESAETPSDVVVEVSRSCGFGRGDHFRHSGFFWIANDC
jgi:CspA family cold shock protein